MGNYFSHDSNARSDSKIIALRMKYKWEGYGLYWALIEKLRDSTCYKLPADYNVLAYDLRAEASTIKSIINDFGLFAFTDDGECFYSESLLRRMEVKDEKSAKARESAKKRWENVQPQSECNATAMRTHNERIANEEQPQSEGNAIKGKKSKVKELKKESTNVDQKEASASSPSLNPDFIKFQYWMKEKAPYCDKNLKSLTEGEFLKLKNKYTGAEVSGIIEQIENRKDLRKRYSNLYRTILNWAKNEHGR